MNSSETSTDSYDEQLSEEIALAILNGFYNCVLFDLYYVLDIIF